MMHGAVSVQPQNLQTPIMQPSPGTSSMVGKFASAEEPGITSRKEGSAIYASRLLVRRYEESAAFSHSRLSPRNRPPQAQIEQRQGDPLQRPNPAAARDLGLAEHLG